MRGIKINQLCIIERKLEAINPKVWHKFANIPYYTTESGNANVTIAGRLKIYLLLAFINMILLAEQSGICFTHRNGPTYHTAKWAPSVNLTIHFCLTQRLITVDPLLPTLSCCVFANTSFVDCKVYERTVISSYNWQRRGNLKVGQSAGKITFVGYYLHCTMGTGPQKTHSCFTSLWIRKCSEPLLYSIHVTWKLKVRLRKTAFITDTA